MRARRPQYAALSNAKLARAGITMPMWQDALKRSHFITDVDIAVVGGGVVGLAIAAELAVDGIRLRARTAPSRRDGDQYA